MYLDILILAHLAERPMHGYEVKKRVDRVLGGSVSLNNNVLYPALRRFTEIGALDKRPDPTAGRTPRHLYELTGTGREVLADLLREFPQSAAAAETEFLVRVAFFDLVDQDTRERILTAREAALAEQIAHIESMRREGSAEGWSRGVVDFVLAGRRRERAWIEELRGHAASEEAETSFASKPAIEEIA